MVHTFLLSAQNIDKSPLSRYGIGHLQQFQPAWIQQMGGYGIGMLAESMINPANPAAQAFLRQTAVEIGVHTKYKDLRLNNGKKAHQYNGNLDYIWLAIPLRNSINELLENKNYKQSASICIGLTPFANSGFRYLLHDSTSQGKTARVLEYSGPINTLVLGFSYRYKNLGVGLNMAYIFGNIRYFQQFGLVNVAGSAYSNRNDEINMKSWRPTLGATYRKTLNAASNNKEKTQVVQMLSMGLQCFIPSVVRFSRTTTLTNVWELNPEVPDTIYHAQGIEERGKLPLGVGIGIYYNHKERFGIQWSAQTEFWNRAKLHASSFGDLQKNFSTSIGLWTRRSITGYGNFFQRSVFRYGLFYNTDYRNIENTRPFRWGGNVGAAIPLVFLRQDAMVHLGLEAGKITTGRLLKEAYIQFNFGVTINDNEWFLKRRYN